MLHRTHIDFCSWAAFSVLGLAVGAGVYVFARLGYEPAWGLGLVTLALAAALAMRRWPIAITACLLVVGNFKTTPAQGITLTDPTMLTLLLCLGAIGIELLYVVSGTSGWTLGRLLAGQGVTIVLFLLFVAILIISFLYTPAEAYGTRKLSRFLAFEVLMFCAPILLVKQERDMRRFLLAMVFLSIALVGKQMISVLDPSLEVLKGNADVTRIGNGMFFSIAILILLYHRFAWPWALTYCFLAALAIGLVASAARSPILALIVTIFTSALSMRRAVQPRERKRLLMALSVTIVVASLSLQWIQDQPGIHKKLVSKEHELAAVASGSAATGGTIGLRLGFYRSALDAFSQHPVLGLGLGGWSVFHSIDGHVAYPHNFLLEVAAEQGLIGLAVLLALLISLFRSAAGFLNHPQCAFLLPVMIFNVLYNSFTGDIENRDLWFWFGMVVAAARMLRDPAAERTRATDGSSAVATFRY